MKIGSFRTKQLEESIVNNISVFLITSFLSTALLGREVGTDRWVEDEALKLQNMRISLVMREMLH
jgi:hypothetical protein